MRKRTIAALGTLVLVVASTVVTAVFFLMTNAGLRVVAGAALPLVPGRIEVGTIEGRLLGPITLRDVRYEDRDAVVAEARRIGWDWHTGALLRRHLHLGELAVEGLSVTVTPQPSEDPGGPPTVPRLPLHITADTVQVEDAQIRVGDAAPVVLGRVRLSVAADEDTYRLTGIDVGGPDFDARGEVYLGIPAPHEVRVDLEGRYRVRDDTPWIEATAEARGDLQAPRLRATVQAPFRADAEAAAALAQDETTWTLSLTVEDADPRALGLDTTLPAGTGLELRAEGGAGTAEVEGTLVVPGTLPAPLAVSASATLDESRIVIERLRAQMERTTVTGNADLARDFSGGTAELAWADLGWPLATGADVASPRGTLNVSGDLAQYRFDVVADLRTPQTPPLAVTATGTGNRESLDADALRVGMPQGVVNGTARVTFVPAFDVRASLAGRDVDLAAWQSGLEGRVGFEGTVALRDTADGFATDVRVPRLEGQLHGQPVRGRVALATRGSAVTVEELDLRAGAARVQASGAVGTRLDLTWQVEVPDMGALLDGAAGSITSRGQAVGTPQRPRLAGSAQADGLRVGGADVATLGAEFDVDLAVPAASKVNLAATDVVVAGQTLAEVRVRTEGPPQAHGLVATVRADLAEAALRLEGALRGQEWRGAVQTLELEGSRIGRWTLREPVPLSVGPDTLTLARTCLARDDLEACVAVTRRGDEWDADGDVRAVPVQLLLALAAPGLTGEGTVTGRARLATGPGGLRGEASLTTSPGRIASGSGDEEVSLVFEPGSLAATLDSVQTTITGEIAFAPRGHANVALTLPPLGGDFTRRPMSGTLNARVEDFTLVPALVPQVGRFDGLLQSDLQLGGTPAAPQIEGQLRLSDATAVLPDLGITLERTALELTASRDRVSIDGIAHSGGGDLDIDGAFDREGVHWRGQLALTGSGFRALELPGVWFDTTPDLLVTVADDRVNVTGTVRVPAARIAPVTLGTAVGVSRDEVIVGAAAREEAEARWRVNGRVEVVAGDDVQLDAYGLAGRLAGTVTVIDAPGAITTGVGGLEIVGGEFSAYGQELQVERGRLEFAGGPIINPGVELLAVREAGDVTVGVQARGPISDPVLSLYSDPVMEQTQTLSYLITGSPMRELDATGQSLVNDAATSLTLSGGTLLASRVGRELGLDTVELEGDARASTSLVLGKHLSPRLYVSYGIGLFESINTLRVRYLVNNRLTLETETGPTNSADLLYTWER